MPCGCLPSTFHRRPTPATTWQTYRQVDPRSGDLTDFADLLRTTHSLGLRVIVDLVPNHTSDEHVWFREALAAIEESTARKRYMFRNGKGPAGEQPPNYWQSVFGGPAWIRVSVDNDKGQSYLHLVDTKQPDLNWQNLEVHAEWSPPRILTHRWATMHLTNRNHALIRHRPSLAKMASTRFAEHGTQS